MTEFAAVFPEYVHLDCADRDTLWLQPFDTEAGGLGRGPRWLHVGLEGDTGSVEFPETFTPLQFHEGRVWGVHIGDFDIEYVAWTELGVQ